MSNAYKETWFIVPMRILDLPGMTLGYLKVYQTIFEFWNKRQQCWLSNPAIEKRTGMKVTQIKDALNFFEKAGELERMQKGLKRYLIQPLNTLEIPEDLTTRENINQVAAPPAAGRSTGYQVAAPAATEIKNRNKELTSYEKKFSPPKPPSAITPVELIETFTEAFPDHPTPKARKGTGELPKAFLKLVKETREEYFQEAGEVLTKEAFKGILISFKSEAPGYCELINEVTGKKLHLNSFIGWEKFQKLINGEYF